MGIGALSLHFSKCSKLTTLVLQIWTLDDYDPLNSISTQLEQSTIEIS